MFVLFRTLVYSTLFIGFFLVFLPGEVIEWSGLIRPPSIGVAHVLALAIAAVGAILALWCIGTFALRGRGTPAPFDPPRQLVVSGPYRIVRNPMYLGAGLALVGAGLFFRSVPLLGYLAAFMASTYLFVHWYEEPALRRTFGSDYEDYCRRVPRWFPRTGRGALKR